MSNDIILIHEQSDMDCLAFAWLWLRFGPARFQNAEVRFTNLAKPNQLLIARAAVVGDLGGYYDPDSGWFDHHQDANLSCAAQLAWEHLNHTETGGRASGDLDYLWPLIELIDQYDRGLKGNTGVEFSNLWGPHAELSGQRQKFRERGDLLTDEDALIFVCNMLDTIATNLKHRDEACQAVQYHTVYVSDDRQLVALYDCNKATCFAACEQGYKLVVFHSQETQPNGETWHHVGLMHNQGMHGPVHCGKLVRQAIDSPQITWARSDLRGELLTWYRDERGFFAGRSAKGNQHQPPLVPIEEIAKALDAAWQR